MSDIGEYLSRQKAWSRPTFGDGFRTEGICRHIEKELAEIRAEPLALEEWIDVIILALDGFWRHGGTPASLRRLLESKQTKNFNRKWPSIQPEDQPVEHIR